MVLLSAHQVRLNACTGGMLNHNRGAGDLAEEALKAVDLNKKTAAAKKGFYNIVTKVLYKEVEGMEPC